jgi:hypothetical protein
MSRSWFQPDDRDERNGAAWASIVTTSQQGADEMLNVSMSALLRRATKPARAAVDDAKTVAANPALLNAMKWVDVRYLRVLEGILRVNRRIK